MDVTGIVITSLLDPFMELKIKTFQESKLQLYMFQF